jgi:hypothetical protein
MRTLCIVVRLLMLTLLPLGAIATAQTGGLAEGNTFYLDNCSICHGVITTGSLQRSRMPAITAPALLAPPVPTGGSAEPMVRVALHAEWREGLPAKDRRRVAIAPPYGPPLRGVYGRPAGSVEGFTYSAEFLKVLRGVVWNRDTLDRWITDSQKWVPGSVMYYKQADPEIRRKIIDYLEIAR